MAEPRSAVLGEAKERLRGFLRPRRLRLTAERLTLLRAVLAGPDHFDTDQLVSRLRGGGQRISRATIYRTLALFEESGILKRSLQHRGRAVYEAAIGKTEHDHLVCVRCGRIVEFADTEFDRRREQVVRRHGYEVLEHLHEVLGICRHCQAKSAEGRRGH